MLKMTVPCFEVFYTNLKTKQFEKHYEEIIQYKNIHHQNFTTKEYACYLYIIERLQKNTKVHTIVKLIDPQFHWILKALLRNKQLFNSNKSTKLKVNWLNVKLALYDASPYDSTFAHNQFLQFPFGYHVDNYIQSYFPIDSLT